jgi:glycosyltransferase involved in cell wall biosynthesis
MKNGGLVSKARNRGFLVYELNFRRSGWVVCLFRLLWLIRRHRIELINTHSSLDAWIGGIAARLSGITIVRTRHLSTAIKKGWNSRFLYGMLADFVVTTCSSAIPMIAKQSGKPLSNCRSIATGVEPERLVVCSEERIRFRRELGLNEGDFLVGTACFMRSWKGIDDLLLAAHRLRHFSDLKWVIIGGGHVERHKIKWKELELEGIVHFTGHLENPFPGIAAMDAFALLSTANEGVSQAILQAAYLGRPLIATPVGGLCEVCIDRKTGLQVPPFDPEAVARAVLELKENRALREQLGEGAHRLAMEQFTMERTLDQMEDAYRLALR